jgi:hypothetical protein
MIRDIATARKQIEPTPDLGTCEHRTVAKDGRIVCSKIVQGEAEISPNVCRACPFKAVNCAHLRFSLEQTEPHRLVVRYNGKTEIWDDEPPELRFEHAACAAKVLPIDHPRQCANCALYQPVAQPVPRPARRRVAAAGAKVVPFPQREAVAATG